MLLSIQQDESLHSYIDRNIFLDWQGPAAIFFKQFSKSVLSFGELKTIASAMGWERSIGLNRLLHLHTDYPRNYIFKNSRNLYFAQYENVERTRCAETKRDPPSFCVECIKDDLSTHGFSFWRRSHQVDIKVCAKHNVLLQKNCPYCGRSFTHEGHGLDVLWSGCEGRSLVSSVAVINDDSFEYKRSKILSEIYASKYRVSESAAQNLLLEKISSNRFDQDVLVVRFLKDIISSAKAEGTCVSGDSRFNGLIFEAIAIAYDSFNLFLDDMRRELNEFYSINFI